MRTFQLVLYVHIYCVVNCSHRNKEVNKSTGEGTVTGGTGIFTLLIYKLIIFTA